MKCVYFAAGFVLATVLGGPAMAGVGVTERLLESGAPAPDGNGVINNFEIPTLSNSGEVILLANLSDLADPSSGQSGVFRTSPNGLVQVVRRDQHLPEGDGNFAGGFNSDPTGPFSPVLPGNAAGQVVFTSYLELTDGPSVFGEGVFFAEADGQITTVSRSGQATPDALGTFDTFSAPVINEHGIVAFGAEYVDATNGNPVGSGLYRWDAGVLTQLVTTSTITPSGDVFEAFERPTLSANGRAIFRGDVRDSGDMSTTGRGIYIAESNGILTQIARSGQAAPEGNGEFDLFGKRPAINDQGQAVFISVLSGTSGGFADNMGMYRGESDGSLTPLARRGQVTPSGHATFGQLFEPAFNAAGQVGFSAYLNDPNDTSGQPSGIYRAEADGTVFEIATTRQTVPNGKGMFDFLLSPAMNESGQMAFLGTREGNAGEPSTVFGLHFFDDRLGLLTIVEVTDFIEDEEVIALLFSGNIFNPDQQRSGLNDDGQVAYTAIYESDLVVVNRWTPPSINDLTPGDANLDGDVDLADFLILRDNFGDDDAFFTTGDFNGDQVVDLQDFLLLRDNFGDGAGELRVPVVPEPTMVGLLAVGGLMLRRRRVA